MPDEVPRRGEVWQIDLGVPVGHEAGMDRPAVVVSADDFNRFGLVVVLPITRTDKPYPTRVPVTAAGSGLDRDSYVQVEQVRTISTRRLMYRRGALGEEVPQVEEILRILFDL